MKHLTRIIASIGATLFLALPALHAQASAPVISSVCPSPLVGPTTQGKFYTGTVLISGQNLQGGEITTDGPLLLLGSSTVNSAGTRISRGFSIGQGVPFNGQQFHFFVGSASILDTISLSPTEPDPTCPGAVKQSGALLEINGTVSEQPVDLFITDGTIHSLLPGSTKPTSPCDGLPSDSYVLQGGSPMGCDNGSTFETAQKAGHSTFSPSSGLYQLGVTTAYQSGCNSAGNICGTGEGPTGLLTVTNTGTSAFIGTITLSGTSPICGSVSDTFSGTLFAGGNGSSVTLALPDGGDSNNSDSSECGGFQSNTTTVGDIQPVAPGTTTTLLPDGPLTQTITIPVRTVMGRIAAMRDVLRLVDGAACDLTVALGNPGDPNFFGGSAVPGSSVPGSPGANPQCLRVSGNDAGIITNQCFDSSGNQLTDCSDMFWNGTNLIGLDSLYSNSVDPQDPAYVIAHDDNPHQFGNSPGPDWTDISRRFQTGCTTPPCGGGGGGKRLNGQETVIDLHLTCQIFTFGISPATVHPGSWIKVSGALTGCAATKTLGLFTFTFEGPMIQNGVCTSGGRVSIPPPPPPGGQQGGFKVTLPPSGVNVPFSFYLPVPGNACTGQYKFTTTILSGGFFYNPNATLTVQQ